MSDCIAWATTEVSHEEVQWHFTQARRNGYAAWIWRDIDTTSWRAAIGEIVTVARKVLAGEPRTSLICNDPRVLCIAAYTSGMGPLLGYWTENGTVQASNEIVEMLCLHLAHNRRRMARLSGTATRVVQQLSQAGVAPVMLKGMHTAFRYFPEPGVRPLSDIDLFVPAEGIAKTEQVFTRLGYQCLVRTRAPYACDWIDMSVSRNPRTLTFVHEDDPWSFDVLGSLDKRLSTGVRIRLDALLPGSAPEEWPCNGCARAMRQSLLALYLAVHFSQTLLNATVLRALEIVLVIGRDSIGGKLDWDEFVHGAKRIGGARFVYPALVMVEQLAPGTIPEHVMAASKADAPENLRKTMDRLTLATAQPLDRHSVRERFMWAASWRQYFLQVASELSLDRRGRPLETAVHSIGTKLWALRRRRYSA